MEEQVAAIVAQNADIIKGIQALHAHNGGVTQAVQSGLAHSIKLGGATENNVPFFCFSPRSSIFVEPRYTILYHISSILGLVTCTDIH